MTPTLRSLRLILHAYTPMLVAQEHVDWLNDADLIFYSEQRHIKHDMWSQYNYVRSFGPCDHAWVIRCGAHDIGTITAHIDQNNATANMGILIGNRSYQGIGLAREAWLAVMEWLFSQGVRKVEAGCREDNWPMRRLARATDMRFEGEIPGHFKVGDESKAMMCFGRFKEETGFPQWDALMSKPVTSYACSSA